MLGLGMPFTSELGTRVHLDAWLLQPIIDAVGGALTAINNWLASMLNAGAVAGCVDINTPSQAAYHVWQIASAGAFPVLALALAFRVLMEFWSAERQPSVRFAIANNLFRVTVVALAIETSYAFLGWLHTSTCTMANGIFTGFMNASASGANGTHITSLSQWIQTIVGTGAAGSINLPGQIIGLCVLLAVFYVAILVYISQIANIFLIVTAPFAIAMAVYDTKNHLTDWWWKAFMGSLMIPIMARLMMGLTVTLTSYQFLAATSGNANPFMKLGPQLGSGIFTIIAMWLTWKAVHQVMGHSLFARFGVLAAVGGIASTLGSHANTFNSARSLLGGQYPSQQQEAPSVGSSADIGGGASIGAGAPALAGGSAETAGQQATATAESYNQPASSSLPTEAPSVDSYGTYTGQGFVESQPSSGGRVPEALPAASVSEPPPNLPPPARVASEVSDRTVEEAPTTDWAANLNKTTFEEPPVNKS